MTEHSMLQMCRLAHAGGHTALSPQHARMLKQHHRFTYDLHELPALYAAGVLLRGPNFVAMPELIRGEQRIADFICEARSQERRTDLGPPPVGTDTDQQRAWGLLATRRFLLLSGLPGAGKTWLLARFVEAAVRAGKLVACAAPTGKAASVLSLKLGGYPVSTVHRLLGIQPGQQTVDDVVQADVLVIDEATMLDSDLLGLLLDCLSPETQVVLSGDPAQLPPVGAGSPFADLCIYSSDFKVAHAVLTGCHRAAETSTVTRLARTWLKTYSQLPLDKLGVEVLPGDESVAYQRYLEEVQHDAAQAHRVLLLSSLRQSKFDHGTEALNKNISAALLPTREFGASKFTAGDRVMFTVNQPQYGFVNGELGTLLSYSHRTAVIRSDGGKEYRLEGYQLSSYAEHGYALTIHKAQGSEAEVVILLLHPEAGFMYSSNSVYTAITRARQQLVLIGDPKLLDRARRRPDVRNTALAALVQEPLLRAKVRRTEYRHASEDVLR